MDLLIALTWFSGLSFVYFGISCFISEFIIQEFERYNLPKFRVLIGILQCLGALGLIVGMYFSKLLLLVASSGLFVLMFAGFIVRLKIKDDMLKSSPAIIYAFINLLIAIKAYQFI